MSIEKRCKLLNDVDRLVVTLKRQLKANDTGMRKKARNLQAERKAEVFASRRLTTSRGWSKSRTDLWVSTLAELAQEGSRRRRSPAHASTRQERRWFRTKNYCSLPSAF